MSKRRCIDHSDRPCPRRPQPSRAHIILCARGPYYECNMAGLCSSPGGRHPIKSSLHRMQVLGPSNALLPTGAFYHLSPRARIYSLCSWSILLTQWPGLGSSPGVRHPLSCLSVSPRIRANFTTVGSRGWWTRAVAAGSSSFARCLPSRRSRQVDPELDPCRTRPTATSASRRRSTRSTHGATKGRSSRAIPIRT